MKIVVNAVALKWAGGKSVLNNFLRAFQASSRSHHLQVMAPAGFGYEDFPHDERIRIHTVPSYFHNKWARPLADRYWLRRQIEEMAPDVIFSMGNIAVPTRRKQLVLFMWPYATYPNSVVWQRMSWRDAMFRRIKMGIFKNRLQYATVVAPQTKTSADRLRKYYPQIPKVAVIPTAVSLDGFRKPLGADIARELERTEGCRKLLCLTRYYPHKNLEVLLNLAETIARENKPYRIILTIAADHHAGASKMLDEIESRNLGDILVNVGPVPMDEVAALYHETDGLLLPTLLESFSGTYVDAMYYQKPIFTSDRDFAHEVCADAAYYFDPHNADDILNVVEKAYEDEDSLTQKMCVGYKRVQEFPDWNEVASQYITLLERIVQGDT